MKSLARHGKATKRDPRFVLRSGPRIKNLSCLAEMRKVFERAPIRAVSGAMRFLARLEYLRAYSPGHQLVGLLLQSS